MNIKPYLIEFTKPLHAQVYADLEEAKIAADLAIESNSELQNSLSIARASLAECMTKKEEKKSAIDLYFSSKYQLIPNKAYINKRGKKSQSMWLNQMITPQAWEVQNFVQKYAGKDGNVWTKASTLGEALAKHTTWVDEQKLYEGGDFYLYPEETLTTHKDKCDCEDVSYTFASFMPSLVGVCYGFYTNAKENQIYGHAYPVVLYDSELFIVETTGTRAELVPYSDVRYDTHFIVTKDYTYQVKSGVEFGSLASWD